MNQIIKLTLVSEFCDSFNNCNNSSVALGINYKNNYKRYHSCILTGEKSSALKPTSSIATIL